MAATMSALVNDLRKTPNELDYAPGGRPLTGRKALAILVGFFLLVGGVNGVMIYFAIHTFRGEVVAHPYERGLAYNRDIAQARAQAAREWKVAAHLSRNAADALLVVIAQDAAGAPVRGAALRASLLAPADLAGDVTVTLEETAPGRYEGRARVAPGLRDLVLTAERDGREEFRSKSRIAVE